MSVSRERHLCLPLTICISLFLLGLHTPVSRAADSSVVAHWSLDEGAGNAILDSSGNGHTGLIINGTAWTTGTISGALKFDGVDDYANMGHLDFAPSSACTIALWIYPQGSGSGYAPVITQHEYVHPFRIQISRDTYRLETCIRTGSSTNYLYSQATLAPGRWTHAAMVYQSGQYVLYLNGKQDSTRAVSGSLKAPGPQDYTMLGWDGNSTAPFSGRLDDIWIFSRALSAIDIAQMLNPSSPPPNRGTYFVNFDDGLDTNDGLSTRTAWKHAPGDAGATGNAASIHLTPGNTVLFKGGVLYRGSITINASGAEGKPITYKGDGWGWEKAVVDGSEPLTTNWTPCASPGDCGGNPNWSHIFYTTAPPGYDYFTPLYTNDDFLWFSQSPSPSDPLYYENRLEFHEVPKGDPNAVITRTSLTDPRYLTQTDPGFWTGSYISVWCIPNVVRTVRISGFDPASHTLYFDDIVNDLYTDRSEYYSLLNHPTLIDGPRKYALRNQLIYAWLDNPGQPAITVGRRNRGINVYGHSNIVIEGFKVQKFYGGKGGWGQGVGILSENTGHTASNIIIRNNDITRISAFQKSGALYLDAENVNAIVEGNRITENRNRGILASARNLRVRNNLITRVTGTGMLLMWVNHGEVVYNTLNDIRGSHANGISVYDGCVDVLVANNLVLNALMPFTAEASTGLCVFGNILDSGGWDNNLDLWSGMTGTNCFVNNTLPRNRRHYAMTGISASDIVMNNIVDGGGGGTHNYNVYTGLGWDQSATYGWSLGAGEIVSQDLQILFASPQTNDFRLKKGSPAIDAGVNPLYLLPVMTFPDFDFTRDIFGVRRPQNGIWDIGASEYDQAPTADVPASNWTRYR